MRISLLVGLSLFFVVGSLVQIVGILFSKPLADRFGNKAVFIAGMSVTTVRSIRQPVASLSGGQRQAVAIAKSVLWNSRLVIMDEPTAALGVAQTAMAVKYSGSTIRRRVSAPGMSRERRASVRTP